MYEDRPGKPGMIGNVTGSFARFLVPCHDLHCKKGVLHMSVLKSYEHMGVLLLKLYRTNTTSSGGCSIRWVREV